MQEALLVLLVVLAIILIWIIFQRKKEGFLAPDSHSAFVERQLGQYGNIPISLIAGGNRGTLGNSADAMLRTPGHNERYPINDMKDGFWAIVDSCEKIKTMDCSAFDNQSFATNCGMCLDIGRNSVNASTAGGLVLLPTDKETARASRKSSFIPEYVPTIGFCPAKKLVSTKEECLKLQRQIMCQKNGSYDLPGCSQCFSDGSYTIIDPSTTPGVINGYGQISVVGVGSLKIQQEGSNDSSVVTLSPTRPHVFQVSAKEGGRIRFVLDTPENASTNSPVVNFGGYLTGTTFSGVFTQDLRRIVFTDEITGRKPRTNGVDTLDGNIITKMAPGFGQTTMNLIVIVPFTFIEPTMEEATMCKDAPFVTSQASAEFLGSDPCYVKGSGPGNYNLECLQSAWLSNGCTASGKSYPKDSVTAATLMTAENGSLKTLNEISDFIYNNALITSTGIDGDGQKQSQEEWSAASVFCTGVELKSPCDGENRATGPLSPECIVFLWNNQGADKLWASQDNPIGATYYTSDSVSLFKEGSTMRACQATGTLSPIHSNGSMKNDIIRYWQTKGGIEAVKKLMADLHRAANAQAIADDKLAPYFEQCYGAIKFANPSAPPSPPPIPDSVGCSNYVFIKDMDLPAYKSDDNIMKAEDGLSPYELTQLCDQTPGCKGVNIEGWIKRTVYSYDKLAPVGHWRDDPKGGVYIKKSAIGRLIPRQYWRTTDCKPPTPPTPPFCLNGFTWKKLGDYKLGFINTRGDYNLAKPEYQSDGWIFTADTNDWTKMTNGQRNEMWATVVLSNKDADGKFLVRAIKKSGLSSRNVMGKQSRNEYYPDTQPREGVWVNYLLKHPTKDSYVTLMRNGIPWFGEPTSNTNRGGYIIGEYKGNNQPNPQTLVDQIGLYKGTPLMNERYELFYALQTDTC